MDAAKNGFFLELLTLPNFCQLCPARNELYTCQTEKPLKLFLRFEVKCCINILLLNMFTSCLHACQNAEPSSRNFLILFIRAFNNFESTTTVAWSASVTLELSFMLSIWKDKRKAILLLNSCQRINLFAYFP